MGPSKISRYYLSRQLTDLKSLAEDLEVKLADLVILNSEKRLVCSVLLNH